MFTDEWHNLSAELQSQFSKFQSPPPDLLFHYTDLAGLKGIVETHLLWATHTAFLNDRSELAYAQELFDEVANRIRTRTSSSVAHVLLERARRTIDPSNNNMTCYVVSFCEANDLLSQWRAYGDRGSGYALGFAGRRGLWGAGERSQPEARLRKIVYDRETQKEYIDRILSGTITLLERHSEELVDEPTQMNTIANAIAFMQNHLWECYPIFKNPDFREENEWRLVIAPQFGSEEEVRFRARGNQLIPYLEMPIHELAGVNAGKLPLECVVIGPTISSANAESSIYRFLRSHQYHFTRIERSSVPLRPI